MCCADVSVCMCLLVTAQPCQTSGPAPAVVRKPSLLWQPKILEVWSETWGAGVCGGGLGGFPIHVWRYPAFQSQSWALTADTCHHAVPHAALISCWHSALQTLAFALQSAANIGQCDVSVGYPPARGMLYLHINNTLLQYQHGPPSESFVTQGLHSILASKVVHIPTTECQSKSCTCLQFVCTMPFNVLLGRSWFLST